MSSFSKYLPGLMIATAVGVASGYYTFQPLLVEETAKQKYGSLSAAEAHAESEGKELLNTAIRKTEARHARFDERIDKAATISDKDKQ